MSKATQLSFPAADPFILRAVDGRYYGRTEATGNDRIAFISPAHFDEQGRLVIDAE